MIVSRAIGAYADTAESVWRPLVAWFEAVGLPFPCGSAYGLLRDDPCTSRGERWHYDACLDEAAAPRGIVPSELTSGTLPGGTFACVKQRGIDRMGDVIRQLRSDWSDGRNLGLDATRPMMVVFHSEPSVAEAARLFEVCLPISVLREVHSA